MSCWVGTRRQEVGDENFLGVSKNGFDIYLTEDRRLNEKTKVKGQYESALKHILLEDPNLKAYYEPFQLPLSEAGAHTIPDFVIDIGSARKVILDVHCSSDMPWTARLRRVRENYGNIFHVVAIDRSHNASNQGVMKHIEGKCDFADEQWVLPYLRVAEAQVPWLPKSLEMDVKSINQEDLSQWKRKVLQLLGNLFLTLDIKHMYPALVQQ